MNLVFDPSSKMRNYHIYVCFSTINMEHEKILQSIPLTLLFAISKSAEKEQDPSILALINRLNFHLITFHTTKAPEAWSPELESPKIIISQRM